MDDEYWANQPIALTTTDVAEILRVGEPTVLRRVKDGLLPGYLLSTQWLVFRDELRAFIEAGSNRNPSPLVVVDALDGFPEELTFRDLMQLLGKSKPTIYTWLENGVVPGYKVNDRWLIFRKELRQALDDVRNSPRA